MPQNRCSEGHSAVKSERVPLGTLDQHPRSPPRKGPTWSGTERHWQPVLSTNISSLTISRRSTVRHRPPRLPGGNFGPHQLPLVVRQAAWGAQPAPVISARVFNSPHVKPPANRRWAHRITTDSTGSRTWRIDSWTFPSVVCLPVLFYSLAAQAKADYPGAQDRKTRGFWHIGASDRCINSHAIGPKFVGRHAY